MTVAELIRELQAMPNQGAPVYVRVDVSDIQDMGALYEEAPVDDVRNEGPFVRIRVK